MYHAVLIHLQYSCYNVYVPVSHAQVKSLVIVTKKSEGRSVVHVYRMQIVGKNYI